MLNIGVIGIGVGMHRARLANKRSDCNLKMIAGYSNEARAKEAAQELNCTYTMDASEVWKDSEIDVVVVSSPNTLHYDQVIHSLNAGHHVFVEYPMAQSQGEIQEILDTAVKKNRIVSVGLSTRYEVGHLLLKEALPKIGDPIMIQANTAFPTIWKWAKHDHLLGDYASLANFHHIDHFIDLFGKVRTHQKWYREQKNEQGENILLAASMHLVFENQVVGYSHFAMGTPGTRHWHYYVLGSQGCIEYRVGEDQITLQLWNETSQTFESSIIQPEKAYPPSLETDFSIFLDAILYHRPNDVSGEIGAYTNAICLES